MDLITADTTNLVETLNGRSRESVLRKLSLVCMKGARRIVFSTFLSKRTAYVEDMFNLR